jgi:hypothetical protein
MASPLKTFEVEMIPITDEIKDEDLIQLSTKNGQAVAVTIKTLKEYFKPDKKNPKPKDGS